MGWKVMVPAHPPDFALKSASVYRIEVAAATFLGLYLVAMALVLALYNRAFSEIGVNGLKAQELANLAQQDAIRGQDAKFEALWTGLEEVSEAVEQSLEELKEQKQKLEDLEDSPGS